MIKISPNLSKPNFKFLSKFSPSRASSGICDSREQNNSITREKGIREVSLYVITYENPYVVRAGERGQLSYVNLSTDFRRKALSYVGSSVGLFEIFFSHFPHLSMATFKPRETQGTHTVHRVHNIMENAVSVHGAYGGRMQPTRLQSNNACLAVVEKSRRAKPNSPDFYV